MARAKTNAQRPKRVKAPANRIADSSDEEKMREILRMYESISAELTVLEEQVDQLLKRRLHLAVNVRFW
jgi:ribosomal protein S4